MLFKKNTKIWKIIILELGSGFRICACVCVQFAYKYVNLEGRQKVIGKKHTMRKNI